MDFSIRVNRAVDELLFFFISRNFGAICCCLGSTWSRAQLPLAIRIVVVSVVVMTRLFGSCRCWLTFGRLLTLRLLVLLQDRVDLIGEVVILLDGSRTDMLLEDMFVVLQ